MPILASIPLTQTMAAGFDAVVAGASIYRPESYPPLLNDQRPFNTDQSVIAFSAETGKLTIDITALGQNTQTHSILTNQEPQHQLGRSFSSQARPDTLFIGIK